MVTRSKSRQEKMVTRSKPHQEKMVTRSKPRQEKWLPKLGPNLVRKKRLLKLLFELIYF